MSTATESELELRQAVTKTLEHSGVLGSLRAQLRAAVFSAIADGEAKTSSASASGRLAALDRRNPNAGLAVALVRDLLEALECKQTLAVLGPELNDGGASPSRRVLREDLALDADADADDTPVLLQLLSQWTGGGGPASAAAPSAAADRKQTAPAPAPAPSPAADDAAPLPPPPQSPAAVALEEMDDMDELLDEMDDDHLDDAPLSIGSPTLKPPAPRAPRRSPAFDAELSAASDSFANSPGGGGSGGGDGGSTDRPEVDLDASDVSAQLHALDAQLKEEESKDATGTLRSLRSSTAVDAAPPAVDGEDEDEDEDDYGEDFEDDFEDGDEDEGAAAPPTPDAAPPPPPPAAAAPASPVLSDGPMSDFEDDLDDLLGSDDDAYRAPPPVPATRAVSPPPAADASETTVAKDDLQNVTAFQLKVAKAKMNSSFEANQLKDGDEGYKHDVQVDFEEGESDNDWDDSD